MCIQLVSVKMIDRHTAWGLLFYNPFFWKLLDKHGFKLREVCRAFRNDIPEHEAINAIFESKQCRKVTLFSLLPLSVNDVIRMKSPMVFLDAFSIAVRKAGGFENCMAIMRDRGWRRVCEINRKRKLVEENLVSVIRRAGLDIPFDMVREIHQYVSIARGHISRAVMWNYSCSYEGLMEWEQYNPYQSTGGVRRSRRMHTHEELIALRTIFCRVVGFWYKGIRCDVFKAEGFIRGVREGNSRSSDNVYRHHMISGGVLMIGIITFYTWTPPPPRRIALW
jgi:hypothetical protein